MDFNLTEYMLKNINNDIKALRWRAFGFITNNKSELRSLLLENHIDISNYNLDNTHHVNNFEKFIEIEIINAFSRQVENIPYKSGKLNIAEYVFDNCHACRRYMMSKYQDIYILEILSNKEKGLINKFKGALEKYKTIN